MRKILKYTSWLMVVAVAALVISYGYVVYQARAYTRTVIAKDLMALQWRKPGAKPIRFEIQGSDLSERQVEILIKVQDPGFYSHKGIDLSTPGAGLTTITQAVVKKLYFDAFKSGIAKIKQSVIARFVANDLLSKEDQITLFINAIYFGSIEGRPVTGLQSAAYAYYGKPVQLITEEQYISLVAMIVMPGTFHLLEHPEWNKERTHRIKSLIAGQYKPKGLMDQFYGELPPEVIDAGLPSFSYFGDKYKDK